jgi:hypothetical protein
VTAIEAFLENRTGIQNDINPLANFVAEGIVVLAKGNLSDYADALSYLEQKCQRPLAEICSSDEGLQKFREQVKLPENITLPRTADVETYHELFSPRQLMSLALLKDAIEAIPQEHAKKGMLLAWSATLTKLNKTFLSARGRAESRGGSSIFSIYRYKVAKEPIELPPWGTFHERARNVIKAKIEIDNAIRVKERTGKWCGRFEVHSEDIQDLSNHLQDSIDYVFTDPPYGGHIAYMDLSTLWNHWLGLSPDRHLREQEMIVGGELQLSEDQYIDRLRQSIRACLAMLKRGRWFSVVFQHWNTAYFEAILTSAAEAGAELRAAVSQIGDPIWSMHKKKRKDSILAGELILTFYKTGEAKQVEKDREFNVVQVMGELLEETHDNRIYGEYLFNKIVVEAWKRSAIRSLNISRDAFIRLLEENGWYYDAGTHCWVTVGHQSRLPFSVLD